MPKSPSKAKDDRQPRQSNGTAKPPMRPARPPAPAPPPRPAPTPPATGARGMNVGARLEAGKEFAYGATIRVNGNLHRISVDRSVWSWSDGHDSDLHLRGPSNSDVN